MLFSRFAQILQSEERLGDYGTLAEAYQAGEAYLQTITAQTIREKTDYSEQMIERLLSRLPQESRGPGPAEHEPEAAAHTDAELPG